MLFIFTNFSLASGEAPLKGVGVDIAGVFKGYSGARGSLRNVVGREERIISKVFQCMETPFDMSLAPFGRHLNFFKSEKSIDFVTTVYGQSSLKGFRSDAHITYYNGVSYLEEKFGQSIQTLEDLKGKRVISFVGAKDMFPQLKKIIPKLKSYTENSSQAIHSKMLFNGRVDVVISDAVIFAHHTAELQDSDDKLYRKSVKFKQIFTPRPFFLVFKAKPIRDKFNECLVKLKANKTIEHLNIEYYNEMIINK